jgi:hypothetical protein
MECEAMNLFAGATAAFAVAVIIGLGFLGGQVTRIITKINALDKQETDE